jgi:hypothetical protein
MTTNSAPPTDSSVPSRLMAVEHGLSHFREIADMRHQHVWKTLEELQIHNNQQDADREVMEEKLLIRIAEIYQLLWSGMKWLAALFASTLLAIVLKASGVL